jgi:hypothetical protein
MSLIFSVLSVVIISKVVISIVKVSSIPVMKKKSFITSTSGDCSDPAETVLRLHVGLLVGVADRGWDRYRHL